LSAGVVGVDEVQTHEDLTNEAFFKELSLPGDAIEASTDRRQSRLELIFIDEATPDHDLLGTKRRFPTGAVPLPKTEIY